MNDTNKTKTELIAELKTLRRQVQKLEREIKLSAHEKERFLKTPCAEDAFRKNTKKFAAVFDGINDAIAIHDLGGRFLEVNESLCERLGYTRKELLNMTPEDIDTEDNAALVKRRIKLLQKQGHLTFESVHVRKNRTTFPVEVNSRIIDYSGTKAVLSVARDISERKQAEEALAKSERQLRTITDTVPVLISRIDAQGRYKFVNARYEEWFGKLRSEIAGKHIRELIGDKAYKRIENYVKQALSGHRVSFEDYIPYMGGDRYVSVSYVPDISEAGNVMGFYALVHDISQRKKIENALKESEERYSTMVNSSPNLVLVHKNGIVHYINELVLEMTGYQRDEVIGKSMFAFLSDDSKELAVKNMQRRISGEHVDNYEVKVITKSKDIKYFLVSASVIPYEQDKAFLVVLSDITERRETANRLEQYRERLSDLASQLALAAENERHRFADELHDITGQNLALAKIKLSELRDLTDNEDKRNIKDRLDDVLKLIDEAVISTRSLTFELSPPILYELGFEATAEWFGEQILKRYNIAFHFNNDKQPKPLTDDMKVLLYLSLRELIVNIAKHAKARNATLSIRRESDNIHISVSDDGAGFDASTTDYEIMKAASFGLFSTRERIERLGGRLEVTSQPGQGTTVTMVVPLKENNEH